MKYIAFNIKNYKGIEDLELNLSSAVGHKIFTLVGLNESGKTTILEAINLFQQGILSGQEHTMIPKSKKANFNESVSITATLEIDSGDEQSIRTFAKSVGFKIKEDVFPRTIKIEKRYTFSSSRFDTSKQSTFWTLGIVGTEKGKKKEKNITGEMFQHLTKHISNELLPRVIYYPNFLTKFPNRIYLQPTPNEDEGQSFYREVLQDILDSLGQGLTVSEHLISRIQSSEEQAKASLDVTLNKVAAKITTTVFKDWEELFASKGKKIVIEKGVENISALEYSYIDIKLEEGSDTYYISERSLGFTWFFSFLLFTEFRKNRVKDHGEILFLIDEPASNLHSTAQTKLLKTFDRIVSKSKLIYTTHSHHLINPALLEGAYIVRNKAVDYEDGSLDFDAQKTDITADSYRHFVARHPDQHTYFQPILDTLEYQPSNLELVPEIVVVEGKNDYYTFRYIYENYISGETKKALDLKFYPGNGAGSNDRVIRLYTAWGRNFIVLVDGDSAGRNAKKKYAEEIGDFMNSRCLPLNEIESKWFDKSTEDIFTPTEQMKIIKETFPKQERYSKSYFNESIQSLLSGKKTLPLNSGTIKHFERIFEEVSARLKSQKSRA